MLLLPALPPRRIPRNDKRLDQSFFWLSDDNERKICAEAAAVAVADVVMLLSKWVGRIHEQARRPESKWKRKIAMSDGPMLFLAIESEHLIKRWKSRLV